MNTGAPVDESMNSIVSIEVSSRCNIEKACKAYFELGAERVFVTWRPNEVIQQFCETCVKLSAAGISVVPHMVARNLRSVNECQTLLLQFERCSGIDALMLLGGDVTKAAGPYHNAIDLLADQNFQTLGINKIFIAGYPQGHALISQEELAASLIKKAACIRALNLEPEIVTQLCTSMADSIAWALTTKGRHNVDVRISVPLGNKEIIKRRLKQIYPDLTALKSASNHDVEALKFLSSACKKLQSGNTQLSLHLIPFHDMDTLLNYTNEIITMLESELS